ncbi:hypothetical protein NKI86_16565 [Mesorhizobium sp. M0320]|uniref:hypothetical protein n=1 Tax=unclassified Mesorhizobium TaxID=325217 RepID=UPI00333B9FF2
MNASFGSTIHTRTYQLPVTGTCMEPIFPAGGTAFMTQDVSPDVGDHVCVFFREGILRDGRIRHAILTELSDEAVSLTQLNPPATIPFPRRAILAMHKIYAIQVPGGCFVGLPEASTKMRPRIEDTRVASVTTTNKPMSFGPK